MKYIKDNFFRLVKGIVIGIAIILPGVSGSTLAVILGVYDDIIEALANFEKHFKKSVVTMLPLVIGVGIGFLAFWYPLIWLIAKAPLPTMAVFAGFILGGFPEFFGKIKGNFKVWRLLILILTMLLGFSIGAASVLFSLDTSSLFVTLNFWGCISLFLVGVFVSSAIFIPGVSGAMLLIAMGFWDPISGAFKNLLAFSNIFANIIWIGCFGVGMVVGLLSFSRVINMMLKKHTATSNFAIIGFVIGSIISAFYNYDIVVTYAAYQNTPVWVYLLSAALLLAGLSGGYIMYLFDRKSKKAKEEI